MDIAADAVLRSIESHEFHSRSSREDIYGRYEIIVYACGVGDESDAFALQACEIIVAEHFNARFDLSPGSYCCGGKEYGDCLFHFLRPKLGSIFKNAHTPIVAAQHIIVQMKKWR